MPVPSDIISERSDSVLQNQLGTVATTFINPGFTAGKHLTIDICQIRIYRFPVTNIPYLLAPSYNKSYSTARSGHEPIRHSHHVPSTDDQINLL
jgi:hypothetical protein